MTAEPPRPQLPPLKIATNPSHRNSGDPFGEMGTCELRASLMQINSIPCEKNISLSTTRRFKPVSTAISRMKPLPKRVIKSLTFNRCVNATPSFGGYFMNFVCLTLLTQYSTLPRPPAAQACGAWWTSILASGQSGMAMCADQQRELLTCPRRYGHRKQCVALCSRFAPRHHGT